MGWTLWHGDRCYCLPILGSIEDIFLIYNLQLIAKRHIQRFASKHTIYIERSSPSLSHRLNYRRGAKYGIAAGKDIGERRLESFGI